MKYSLKYLVIIFCILIGFSFTNNCTDEKKSSDAALAAVDDSDPVCGNGDHEAGEQCDDENTTDGDGCSAVCLVEAGFACGNSIIDEGTNEQCDDGDANSDDTVDACRSNCALPICGDGVTDAGDECDDENGSNNDGCSSDCTIEFCGD